MVRPSLRGVLLFVLRVLWPAAHAIAAGTIVRFMLDPASVEPIHYVTAGIGVALLAFHTLNRRSTVDAVLLPALKVEPLRVLSEADAEGSVVTVRIRRPARVVDTTMSDLPPR